MSQLPIKRGDDVPIAGVVEIRENKVDTTADYDFSTWEISCQVRAGPAVTDPLVATISLSFIGPTSAFMGEIVDSVSATFPETSYMDIRFKDENGKTRSTQTVVLIAEDSVSVAP